SKLGASGVVVERWVAARVPRGKYSLYGRIDWLVEPTIDATGMALQINLKCVTGAMHQPVVYKRSVHATGNITNKCYSLALATSVCQKMKSLVRFVVFL